MSNIFILIFVRLITPKGNYIEFYLGKAKSKKRNSQPGIRTRALTRNLG